MFQLFFSFHKWISYQVILDQKEEIFVNSHSNLYFNFISLLFLIFLLLAYKRKKKDLKLVFVLQFLLVSSLLISLKYPNLFHVSFKNPDDYVFNYSFYCFVFFAVIGLFFIPFCLKNDK